MKAATPLVSWLSIPQFAAEILSEGWPHFVGTHVHREIEWFVDGGTHPCRFILQSPGFAPPEHEPTFDQWLQPEGTLPGLRDEFAEAWQPVVDAGHEVICYLGPLRWI